MECRDGDHFMKEIETRLRLKIRVIVVELLHMRIFGFSRETPFQGVEALLES